MPRNQSEKLPSCPEAHAYAKACEAVIQSEDEGDAIHVARSAWSSIPHDVMTVLDRVAYPHREPNWRQLRIDYIRKTYAP